MPDQGPPAYDLDKDPSAKDEGSLEKGPIGDYVVQADPRHQFDPADLDRVQRRLKQRHVQMIAVSTSSTLIIHARAFSQRA